jgi:hypothetical protein
MLDSDSPPPTVWDSLKFAIAAGLIVTYIPAGLVAFAYFGPTGGIAVFVVIAAATILLRCSNCSWPLFKRRTLWVPWPWRSCPRCARSLLRQMRNGSGGRIGGAPKPPNTSWERTRGR